MATRSRAAANNSVEINPVPTDDLYLDEANPRLGGRGVGATQFEILQILWREFSVDEVAYSIAANGFFSYEPVFAANERVSDLGHKALVVVEGNRRLAAVMLLRRPDLRRQLRATDLPIPTKPALATLTELPVIECDREEIWRFVGFKHVNGPQQWDALSKAEYIAWVHNDLDVPLADIARQIGDRHSTVQRLYMALMVLRQSETNGVFDRENRFNKRFFFSHLYTGLGYNGIQKYLGISSSKMTATVPTAAPVPRRNLPELGSLSRWLYGDKEAEAAPLVKSQNPDLRLLDEALQSDNGIAALERGLPLAVAVDIAKGDDRILRESLVGAKTSLQTAKSRVVTGFVGEADLLRTARDVSALADSIVGEMEELRVRPAKRVAKKAPPAKRAAKKRPARRA